MEGFHSGVQRRVQSLPVLSEKLKQALTGEQIRPDSTVLFLQLLVFRFQVRYAVSLEFHRKQVTLRFPEASKYFAFVFQIL